MPANNIAWIAASLFAGLVAGLLIGPWLKPPAWTRPPGAVDLCTEPQIEYELSPALEPDDLPETIVI